MSYSADAPWRITAQAQSLLGVPSDGIWGPRTDAAYNIASQSTRARIDRSLAEANLSVYAVRRVTTQVSRPSAVTVSPKAVKASEQARRETLPTLAKPGDNWLTLEQLTPVLSAATQGLQYATLDRMIKKLNLEAAKRTINGVTYYNTRSQNGSFRGLFQMGWKAWKDVEPQLGHSYAEVFDPAVNARAAALYVENNVKSVRKMGYKGPITDDVVYAMHNQGAAGFMQVRGGRAIEGNQSAAARRVIGRATVPQYG